MGSPRGVPGLQRASRYLPATAGAGADGDWFDLISLGDGRVGVLIGDVMGRGLEAATVMGQLRSAVNALARTGMPPRQLMDALDQVVQDLPDQLVTSAYTPPWWLRPLAVRAPSARGVVAAGSPCGPARGADLAAGRPAGALPPCASTHTSSTRPTPPPRTSSPRP
jgi:hypothetical protein